MTDPLAFPLALTLDSDDAGVARIPSEPSRELSPLPDGADDVVAHLQRLKPAELAQVGIAPQDVLRILTLIADVRRLDCALPAAQALAQRIEKSRLDRAQQISKLLGDMAAHARRAVECDPKNAEIAGPLSGLLESPPVPSSKAPTRRYLRAPKADDAPISIYL